MPNDILSLGLPQETVKAISSFLCARTHVARNLAEVDDMLESYDISSIVVNSAACPNLIENVTELLGHTPLTTRIVLLCEDGARLDLAKLASMGIKTLKGSYDIEQLVEQLRR